MNKRLSQAERNQIIYDFINGIPNEEYEVIKSKNGKYIVRKRKSPFVPPEQIQEEKQQETQEIKQPEPTPEEKLNRISKEELLNKLSSLLELKEREQEEENTSCLSHQNGESEDEYVDTAPAPTIKEIQKPDSYMYQQHQQKYTYQQPNIPQFYPPQQINFDDVKSFAQRANRYSRKRLTLF